MAVTKRRWTPYDDIEINKRRSTICVIMVLAEAAHGLSYWYSFYVAAAETTAMNVVAATAAAAN